MWSAVLNSVSDTPTPSPDKEVAVTYSHTDGRVIRRTYSLNAGNAPNAAAVAQFVQREVQLLEANDQTEADLEYLLGSMVTASAIPPPSKAAVVSPYQARTALFNAGLLDAVDAMVQATGGQVKIAWEYATVFERHSPFIDALAPNLGLTDAQVDALFLAASEIT